MSESNQKVAKLNDKVSIIGELECKIEWADDRSARIVLTGSVSCKGKQEQDVILTDVRMWYNERSCLLRSDNTEKTFSNLKKIKLFRDLLIRALSNKMTSRERFTFPTVVSVGLPGLIEDLENFNEFKLQLAALKALLDNLDNSKPGDLEKVTKLFKVFGSVPHSKCPITR